MNVVFLFQPLEDNSTPTMQNQIYKKIDMLDGYQHISIWTMSSFNQMFK